jgi:hypothetical protein
MCREYDEEYLRRLVAQTRQAMKDAEERLRQPKRRASPAAAGAEPVVKQPVPA